MGQSSKPGPSPVTLGEGIAKGDECCLALYPSPQDGILTAICVLSVNKDPVSHKPPMVQQTHCLLPESGEAHSCSKLYGFTPAVSLRAHQTHSDSCFPRRIITGHCLIHPALLVFGSRAQGPRYHQGLTLHFSTWRNRTGHHWNWRMVRGTSPHPHFNLMYYRMMTYITSVFKDVMGQRIDLECHVALCTTPHL
ncbi:hypothetical protein E2C01_071287 [Portunus trituberculatus]|uniref:ZP domain-containing protein n=1 Tax=Portunus trituberculatus TaxID=210409 RepID=A0A5B7I3L2_PORTR|nr:hypothetical protein [Portunus trituberculatus]